MDKDKFEELTITKKVKNVLDSCGLSYEGGESIDRCEKILTELVTLFVSELSTLSRALDIACGDNAEKKEGALREAFNEKPTSKTVDGFPRNVINELFITVMEVVTSGCYVLHEEDSEGNQVNRYHAIRLEEVNERLYHLFKMLGSNERTLTFVTDYKKQSIRNALINFITTPHVLCYALDINNHRLTNELDSMKVDEAIEELRRKIFCL